MKKILLLSQMLFSVFLMAQISYNEDWSTAGLNGWTSSQSWGYDIFEDTTDTSEICGSSGGTIVGERYYGNSGQFTSPVLTGNNQGQITMSFDYKVIDYYPDGSPTVPGEVGSIIVEYATSLSGPWTAVYTINSSNHTQSASCATQSFSFIPPSGDLYVRFNVTSYVDGDAYYYFDNVAISQSAPAICMSPSALTLSNASPSSAGISWTAPSTAPSNGYEVYYSTTSTAPTATTVLNSSNSVVSSTTSANIPGLAANTTYYVWVRSVCSTTDKGYWIGPYILMTPCNATNIPYIQNFDSVTVPALPGCTSVVNSGTGNVWKTTSASTASVLPAGFSGNILNYSYNASNPANTWFFTQGINLTSGVNYRIKYKFSNATGTTQYPEKMKIAYGTMNTAAGMTNQLKDYPSITGGTLTNDYVDFTPPGTGVYYFGFQAYSDTDMNQLYLDDINIDLAPTCLADPSAINITGVTTNSATVNWTAPATPPANGYEIYYSTSNVAPTSAIVLNSSNSVTSSTTSANITVNSGTVYYVWVRGVCSSADKGVWIGFESFTTSCVPVTSLSWTENFDSMNSIGANVLPNPCWLTTAGGSSNDKYFISANAGSNTDNDPKSGPNYVTIYYPRTNAAYLWTPGFQLQAGETYNFSFSWVGDGTSGWQGDVYVNTSQSGTNATLLGNSFVEPATTTTATYTDVTYQFTPATSGIYYFGISALATTFSPNYLGFDDFSLTPGTSLATSEISEKEKIKVYPNPFTDLLNISNIKNVKSISIMDISGRLVKSIDKPDSIINLRELNSGMYVIVLDLKDGSKQTIKAIKK